MATLKMMAKKWGLVVMQNLRCTRSSHGKQDSIIRQAGMPVGLLVKSSIA